jgi:hypothetical protein
LQAVAAHVRAALGLALGAVLNYKHWLGEFVEHGAVVVLVMWEPSKIIGTFCSSS